MYRHRGAAIRRLALLALLALIARACRAAPLPLQWHWLADKVPKAGVRPALLGFFQGLSMEICKGGPGNFTQLSYKWMDEICPLKAWQDEILLLRFSERRAVEAAAPRPRTLAGAALLLASPTVGDAAKITHRLCDVFLDPNEACGWRLDANTSDALQGYRSHVRSLGIPTPMDLLEGLSQVARPPPAPPRFAPSKDAKDPLEAAGEAAAQAALWWFTSAVPLLRSRVVEEFMPPPLRPYVAASLKRLPDALCALPREQVAALPNSFKDEVCPVGNLFKPAFGGVGLGTWTFVAAQVAMGLDVSDGVLRGIAQATGFNLSALQLAAPDAPDAHKGGGKHGKHDDAGGSKGRGGGRRGGTQEPPQAGNGTQAAGNGTGDVNATASGAADAAARDARAQDMFKWFGHMCHVLYSPEVACDPSIAEALTATNDIWQAYSLIQARADPSDLDLQQLRLDARRFQSVAALAAAITKLPTAAVVALAWPLRGQIEGMAARIQESDPLVAIATYGPLKPWICVPSITAVQGKADGEPREALSLLGDAVVRGALRLDEASAQIGAILGDSNSRPALEAACAALEAATKRLAGEAAARKAGGGDGKLPPLPKLPLPPALPPLHKPKLPGPLPPLPALPALPQLPSLPKLPTWSDIQQSLPNPPPRRAPEEGEYAEGEQEPAAAGGGKSRGAPRPSLPKLPGLPKLPTWEEIQKGLPKPPPKKPQRTDGGDGAEGGSKAPPRRPPRAEGGDDAGGAKQKAPRPTSGGEEGAEKGAAKRDKAERGRAGKKGKGDAEGRRGDRKKGRKEFDPSLVA